MQKAKKEGVQLAFPLWSCSQGVDRGVGKLIVHQDAFALIFQAIQLIHLGFFNRQPYNRGGRKCILF